MPTMQYEARVLDPARRQLQSRVVVAEGEADARQSLAAGGLTVLTLRPVSGHPRARGQAVRAAGEVALWCREVRALLQAGLSVVEALDALGARGGEAAVHQALLQRLRAGRPLSGAMQDVGGFPALLVASVRASERTSDLPHALQAYLRFDELVGGLRRKVISASLYPALVVALGAAIAVFLLLVVVPRFASLYGETVAGVGGATRLLLGLSAWLSARPWAVPLAALGLAAAVAWAATGSRPRRAGSAVVRAWPWLAARMADFEHARLYEALALLVRGGYSLHEALDVCAGLSAHARTRARLADARGRIEQGASVSAAFAAAGLTDRVTERLVRAGERGGGFDRVLQAIAERHREAFEAFVERATRVVEPVLLLGVALMVGGMVVLLYMPVFDIAASIR